MFDVAFGKFGGKWTQNDEKLGAFRSLEFLSRQAEKIFESSAARSSTSFYGSRRNLFSYLSIMCIVTFTATL